MKIAVGVMGAMLALPALIFVAIGAWPILGFMAAGLLAVAMALNASFRHGRHREVVTLWPEKLEIVSFDARGVPQRRRFDPSRVRLVIERDINERTMAVKLREGQGEVVVGAFLSPDERSSFAKAFGTALRRARG